MTVTNHSNRREFLRTGASFAVAAAAGSLGMQAPAKAGDRTPPQTSIGIQVGSASFVDEGTEKVLDIFQDRGAIDTIYLTTFTFGRGLAGRQIPGQPFPDHGVQVSDERTFRGGNYASPHAEFYRNTVLRPGHALDHGDLDIVASVLRATKKRGLRVFCSIEDVFRSDVPGTKETAEIDLAGKKAGTLCLCHPDVRAFWTALATDLAKSYDIDGVLFFNERNGPLLNALGASHAQSIASSRVTCFCEHHRKAAKDRGIEYERARQGYQKLDQFVRAALKGERPSDGYFVEFWRILTEWPEIMAWNRLFDETKHEVVTEVRNAVKKARPAMQVGFHIEHVNSFNPIFRATRSYADLATKADFLKIVVYNNCGGERYATFIRNVGSTIFRDVPKEELLRFNNHLLGYGDEAPLGDLATAGLSPDYVFRETKRAIAGVQGKCKVLPGIDIGIPTGKNSRKASPDDTYAAVAAALKAGPDGLVLSRKYSEMHLANLSAAGRAARDAVKGGA
jgi:hypothetical protein